MKLTDFAAEFDLNRAFIGDVINELKFNFTVSSVFDFGKTNVNWAAISDDFDFFCSRFGFNRLYCTITKAHTHCKRVLELTQINIDKNLISHGDSIAVQ